MFYLTVEGQLTATPIRVDSTFDAGNSTVVLTQTYYAFADTRRGTYDVSPDGKRFLSELDGQQHWWPAADEGRRTAKNTGLDAI